MRKAVFVVGLAAGYVLGTRAGRQRYESISRAAQKVRSSQTVQSAAGVLRERASTVAGQAKNVVLTKAGDKLPIPGRSTDPAS